MKNVSAKVGMLVLASGLAIASYARADVGENFVTDDAAAEGAIDVSEDAFISSIDSVFVDGAFDAGTFADPTLSNSDRRTRLAERVKVACDSIQATEQQKKMIHSDLSAYKKRHKTLHTTVMTLKKDFLQNALSQSGTVAIASSLVKKEVATKSELAQAKGDLVTKILFDILKPAQRKPGLKCLGAANLLGRAARIEATRSDLD